MDRPGRGPRLTAAGAAAVPRAAVTRAGAAGVGTTGGVELAGARQWARSLLVMPGLFVTVVVICALAGATNWPVILLVMFSLTVVFEALLVRAGAPSLVVSPTAVVRRTRWRTITVRADEVSDVLVKHAVYGPIMVISGGGTKVGLPLPSAYRKPSARAALASFLRRAGVDAPALRGLGLPAPVVAPRSVAGPILCRASEPAGPTANSPTGSVWPEAGDGASGAGRKRRPSVRLGGKGVAWLTFVALAVTAAVGLLRLFY